MSTEDDPEYIDMNNRGGLEKVINGAFIHAINDHGPITKENRASAVKRVVGAIKNWNKQQIARKATKEQ